MRKFTAVGVVLAAVLAVGGCGGGGSGGAGPEGKTPIDFNNSYAQKEPFQLDASVSAWPLGADGAAAGGGVVGRTGKDGAIELNSPLPWSGPTLVEVEGRFFDETTGQFSSDSIRLQGILQAADGVLSGNVNLFTHLLAARIRFLMAHEEYALDFEEALEHALTEDLSYWLGSDTNPARLNILAQLEGQRLAEESAS